MTKFRIVSNGSTFRVQYKNKYSLFWCYARMGTIESHWVREFDSLKAANDVVSELVAKDNIASKKWRPI